MSAIFKCYLAAILKSAEAVPTQNVEVISIMWGKNSTFVRNVHIHKKIGLTILLLLVLLQQQRPLGVIFRCL